PITAGQIANTTTTAGQIAANTITSGQIANNTITAGQIAANTITAAQVSSAASSGVVSNKQTAYVVDNPSITAGIGQVTLTAACSANTDILLSGGCYNASLSNSPVLASHPTIGAVGVSSTWTCVFQSAAAGVVIHA